MITYILLILVGFVLLIKGADLLVDGASNIAKRFHIPEIIIGLTIVSIGTSLPELFISFVSSSSGSSDMAIGNIIGSNICNLLLILGLSAVIRPVKIQKQSKFVDIPICIFVTILFSIFCNTGLVLSRIEGVILLILFLLFVSYTVILGIKDMRNNKNELKETDVVKKGSLLKDILFIILGIIGLKFGGDLTVDNAVLVANLLHISEKVIGLTILAIGTSLPELVTSIMAAIKGNSDIAVGNIIGSNIFNILLIIGFSSSFNAISYNNSYNMQFIMLIIATVLLFIFPFIKPKDKMSRGNGIWYLIMFVAYMIRLFID